MIIIQHRLCDHRAAAAPYHFAPRLQLLHQHLNPSFIVSNMFFNSIPVFIVITAAQLYSCRASASVSTRLTRYLLSNHDRSAPPDGLIYVDYRIELVSIVGISEIKQQMSVLVYVNEVCRHLFIHDGWIRLYANFVDNYDNWWLLFMSRLICLQSWQDSSLAWTPSDFGSLNRTWLPVTKIWLPDIIVVNMFVC
jgi:hypothetical protein